MIDKSLVKKRFSKSLKTYNDNAYIQKIMAKELIELLPKNNYNSILEVGSATGILTKEIVEKLKFEKYTANDIVENSKKYIDEIIPNNKFIIGDIEEINFECKYDLIIANAVLQWCNDIDLTIKKLTNYLNKDGIIAVSVFGKDNLKEIKNLFKLKTPVPTSFSYIEKEYKLLFDSPIDVLKHIKYTGANSLIEFKFTKSLLKSFEEQYKTLYASDGKVVLTYNPLYIVIVK